MLERQLAAPCQTLAEEGPWCSMQLWVSSTEERTSRSRSAAFVASSPRWRRKDSARIALTSNRGSVCGSLSSRPTAIPAHQRRSVSGLGVYALRAVGESLILTRSGHPILQRWTVEKSTFIRDVTRCG